MRNRIKIKQIKKNRNKGNRIKIKQIKKNRNKGNRIKINYKYSFNILIISPSDMIPTSSPSSTTGN